MALSRRQIIRAAAAATLTVVGIGAYDVVSSHHTVTVQADGRAETVSGFYPDVESVLAKQNIELDEHDEVVPSLQTPLKETESIRVLRATPLTVHLGSGAETRWSTAQSLDEAHRSLARAETSIESYGVSRHHSREELPLAPGPRSVDVFVDGEVTKVSAGAGDNVRDIVRAAGIDLDGTDSVFAVPKDGELTVQVVTESRTIVEKEDEIPFETEYVEDDQTLEGTEKVIEEGSPGIRTTRLYERTVAGKKILSTPLSEAVTKEPAARVVAVGTKQPEPEPAVPPAGPAAGSDVSGVQVQNTDVWAALAQCESGGNPGMNSGNGYYGMYQFSLPTWQSVGGAGLPSDASAAEQTQRAQILQHRSGWGQWPACSARLGLR